MDVSKIQRLSKQHELLKSFHENCNHNDVVLIAKKSAYTFREVELNYETTKPIITEIRGVLFRRINEVEKEIKIESAKL